MDATLSIIQRQISYGWDTLQDIISVPKRQRRLIMVIVCIALLLDNMLYMVIVSIDQCLNTRIYSMFSGSYHSGLFTKHRSMVNNDK